MSPSQHPPPEFHMKSFFPWGMTNSQVPEIRIWHIFGGHYSLSHIIGAVLKAMQESMCGETYPWYSREYFKDNCTILFLISRNEKQKHSQSDAGKRVTKENREDKRRNESFKKLWKGDSAQTTHIESLKVCLCCAYVQIENTYVLFFLLHSHWL